mmetsp:Transcript_87739/g.246530  ORF Transcript_87739/g.246530 Transcript_87739/m.246530 type:complete len:271 (-) Transcript_87739:114-926(-)
MLDERGQRLEDGLCRAVEIGIDADHHNAAGGVERLAKELRHALVEEAGDPSHMLVLERRPSSRRERTCFVPAPALETDLPVSWQTRESIKGVQWHPSSVGALLQNPFERVNEAPRRGSLEDPKLQPKGVGADRVLEVQQVGLEALGGSTPPRWTGRVLEALDDLMPKLVVILHVRWVQNRGRVAGFLFKPRAAPGNGAQSRWRKGVAERRNGAQSGWRKTETFRSCRGVGAEGRGLRQIVSSSDGSLQARHAPARTPKSVSRARCPERST